MRVPILQDTAMSAVETDDIAALARQYGPTVFRAAWRILGARAAAEDVQQQLFLRLIESPPKSVQSWPAYLTASATRLAIDALRRQRCWRPCGNPTSPTTRRPRTRNGPKPRASCGARWRA